MLLLFSLENTSNPLHDSHSGNVVGGIEESWVRSSPISRYHVLHHWGVSYTACSISRATSNGIHSFSDTNWTGAKRCDDAILYRRGRFLSWSPKEIEDAGWKTISRISEDLPEEVVETLEKQSPSGKEP